LLNNILFMWK